MSAKEMFESLGWKLYFKSSVMMTWEKKSRSKKSSKYIQFYFYNKTFCISSEGTFLQPFTVEELQAINKQVEELGWNNEVIPTSN